jgi:hypothetical protein
MHPTLSSRMVPNYTYFTWSTYSNLSRSHQQWWTEPPLPRKRAPTQSTTRRLPDPWVRTKFLSWASHWSSGDKTTTVDVRLLVLLGLYHQHDIGTFNTCSRGPTHRSLIDTSGGYSLEGTGFPHTTLWPSQPTVSPFHLRAPPDL